jgi:catechol 2,3-dioxygenase-like lactoylglutathione lyase family enzyme
MGIVGLDHVQLAIPAGGEDVARRFYTGVLGLEEIPKPDSLAGRGGAWFRLGGVELHLGVEADFRPARKAHPGMRVEGLPALIVRSVNAGHPVERAVPPPGLERVYVADPFGNRIELIERRDAGVATRDAQGPGSIH